MIAGFGGLERLDTQHPAKMIQYGGDMEISVGIDTATNNTGIYDGHCHPFLSPMCAKGWHAPPQRRTSMRSSCRYQLDRRHTARAVSAKPRRPGTDRRVIPKTTNPVSAGS